MSKILPCPHCGESAGLYPAHTYDRLTGVTSEKPHAIDCIQCGYDFVPRDGMDVVAMWNRRFDPTDLSALAKTQDELSTLRLQNDLLIDVLKGAMEELGIQDEFKIQEAIGAIRVALEKADEELAAAGYRKTMWPRTQISNALTKGAV